MTETMERLRQALADRYRVERELGAGGMATVYLAEDLKHQRKVAVKVLRPELAASLGAERFLREIAIAARLNHPHILPLHDSGVAGEFLFYIMPFVEGPSLRDKLAREGELPVEDAVRVLRDVADAMAHAHGQGVVHRDLKPENVMLAGGHAVVTDFGIAKALHAAGKGATLTATGMAVGTPAYMAPEQAAGDAQVDHRADLYALGILGYELLTGAPPFAGASPQQTLLAHLARAPEPIHNVRPSTPPRVAAAVMRCLEKRPADRWQSATEFRQQLAPGEPSSGEAWQTAPATVAGFMPITEDLCRRMDRASFDPRMVGDRLSYLDNQVRSDVLVILIPDWGVEATDPARILPASPYRVVVPTLYGFEAGRKTRIPIGVGDHLVLLEALLGHLSSEAQPGVAVAAGFSAAGDVVLRLAAECAAHTRLDGCLALGCNLGVDTCFVTGVLAEVTSSAPEALLPALTRALGGATTVDDWLNLAEYFHQILGNLRNDFRPVQRFAQGIVAPWKAEGVDALIGWYRAATAAGRLVRCVFEDNEMYRAQVRALQLRNLDEGVLGERYQPGSIIVEPVAGHFDLLEPALVRRHVDALVTDVRAARAS